MKKQIALMHKYFGRAYTERCGTCCNFVRDRYHDRILQKCERYGLTHSEASDWAQSWEACGVYNTPLPDGERPLMEYAGRGRVHAAEVVPGQIGFVGPEPGGEVDECTD